MPLWLNPRFAGHAIFRYHHTNESRILLESKTYVLKEGQVNTELVIFPEGLEQGISHLYE